MDVLPSSSHALMTAANGTTPKVVARIHDADDLLKSVPMSRWSLAMTGRLPLHIMPWPLSLNLALWCLLFLLLPCVLADWLGIFQSPLQERMRPPFLACSELT